MYDFAASALIGIVAGVAVQIAVTARATRLCTKLLPGIAALVGAAACAIGAFLSYMALESSAASENSYILLLIAAGLGAGAVGCGVAAACAAVMKSRFAVILPILAAAVAVGATAYVCHEPGSSRTYDLSVKIISVEALEDGSLRVIGQSPFADAPQNPMTGITVADDIELIIPKKLAEKYYIEEGWHLLCDFKEKNGVKVVKKISKSLKK